MSSQDFKFSLHLKSKPGNDSKCEVHADCGGYISDEALIELFRNALETFKIIFSKYPLGEAGFAIVLADFVRSENQKIDEFIKTALKELSKTASADENLKQ